MKLSLTRRYRFAASHRLYSPAFTEGENNRLYVWDLARIAHRAPFKKHNTFFIVFEHLQGRRHRRRPCGRSCVAPVFALPARTPSVGGHRGRLA